MKITINTKDDSKEDIKKAISFLSKFIYTGSINLENKDSMNTQTNIQPMMGMFGSPEENNSQESISEENDNEVTEEEFDENSRLIPY